MLFGRSSLLFFLLIFMVSPLFLTNLYAIPFYDNGCVRGYADEPTDYSAQYLREQAFADFKPMLYPDAFGATGFLPNSRIVKYDLKHVDNILVLLVEFADEEGIGPLHNNMPAPIPEKNNTDYWVPDFSERHYQHMLFTKTPGVISMSNWYLEQSSGRYSVDGVVKGWYKIPFPEKKYGGDKPGPGGHDALNGEAWRVIEDLLVVIGGQIDWKEFDKEDRYDWDGDGDLEEPDGYVDHLMIIHAGAGQEGGGGAQGDDAIWSHRSKANFKPDGGPDNIGPVSYGKHGGLKTGSSDDIWVLDYTMEPEDGGVGVFAHEFGHDLGLPDLYNVQPFGPESEADTAFWTAMSGGSWTGPKGGPLGTIPVHFGPWEKEQLGWLDFEEVAVGDSSFEYLVQLDRVEHRGVKPQALKINLPKGSELVQVADPVDGKVSLYSNKGDDLKNSVTTELDLTKVAGDVKLTFKTYFEIEQDWDYAYVEVDDGSGAFRSIPGSITTDTNPNGNNLGHGITGFSLGWVDVEFDLSGYVGKSVKLRFRYVTDAAAIEKGFVVDKVEVKSGDTIVFADSFENGVSEWEVDGFIPLNDGKYNFEYSHYYLLEWRTHFGFDSALASAYNMKRVPGDDHAQLVDFFSYDPGLVIWYRNEKYPAGDNIINQHPGEGFLLVVDAKPDSILDSKGNPLRTRLQIKDAAFSLNDSTSFSITDGAGENVTIDSIAAKPVFNDSISYYRENDPDNSVKIPQYGLRVSIDAVSFDNSAVQLRVSSDR